MTLPAADVYLLKEKIIACAIEVHRALGPGLLESVYRDCLVIELRAAQLEVVSERRFDVDYKGNRIADGLKLDLMVEKAVIVEVKAVERYHPVHLAQLITYLKLTGCHAGLLINFNCPTLKDGLRAAVHPDLYKK
jgi:GxxExxY protein